jgi:polysaccharide export outer membrane protein
MKQWKLILVLVLLSLLPANAYANDYALVPGDVLSISVFGMADLSVPETTIRPDGKVTFPPVGEVAAAGLTVADFSSRLTEKLSKFYVNPIISVGVKTFGTTRIYVVGHVTRPGAYDLDKSHTLLDAIGKAEGWTQDALKTKVYIIRSGSRDTPLKVNLFDLLKRGDTSKNYVLNTGDIVYLTNNGKIDINKDVLPMVSPIWLIRHWMNQPTT